MLRDRCTAALVGPYRPVRPIPVLLTSVSCAGSSRLPSGQ